MASKYADYDAAMPRQDINKLLAGLSEAEREKAVRAMAIAKRRLAKDG